MPAVSESLDSSTTKRRLVFRFWNERGFSKHTHTFKKKTRARHGMAKFVYGRKDGQAWTGSGSCAHLVGLTDFEMCFIFVLFFPHIFRIHSQPSEMHGRFEFTLPTGYRLQDLTRSTVTRKN